MDPSAVWGGEWDWSREGVLDGVVIVEGKGQFWGKYGASHCNQWNSLREERRRGSSQITLGFLVFHHFCIILTS